MQWLRYYELSPGSQKYIYIPTDESRTTGSEIINILKDRWKKPEYFYHFRAGGHLSAIKVHFYNGEPCQFSVFDLSGYYRQITRSKLVRVLKKYVGYERALDWAQKSTVLQNGDLGRSIPLGFVQSGFLASLVLDNSCLGKTLREINKTPNIRISVFVDDIIISSQDHELLSFYSQKIKQASKKSNLTLHNRKTFCNIDSINIFNLSYTSGTEIDFCEDRVNNFKEILVNNCYKKFVVFGVIMYMLKVNPKRTLSILDSIVQEKGISKTGILGKFYYEHKIKENQNIIETLRKVCFQ